jgi:Fibronectin type III domain/Protein of unknown function (DUF2510)
MATPQVTSQGWYPDPAGRHASRYWDGAAWTATVSDGTVTGTDALEAPASGSPAWPPPAHQAAPAAPPGVVPALSPPATGRRRRRRTWPALAITAIVVAGAAAGLVAWAPWSSPPVLRPAGLAAGAATTSSVTISWSRPATGPLPDRYLIQRGGSVVASVRGTATSYHAAGLAPATAYQYRVVAVRGGARSPASVLLTARTATPPLSAALLQGQWTVDIEIVRGGASLSGKGPKRWTEPWLMTPACSSGTCPVELSAQVNGHAFTAMLRRNGAAYAGNATANVFPCGSGPGSFPIHSALTIRITITSAQVNSQVWTASSFTGTLALTSPYTSSGNHYCPASSRTATLTGIFP